MKLFLSLVMKEKNVKRSVLIEENIPAVTYTHTTCSKNAKPYKKVCEQEVTTSLQYKNFKGREAAILDFAS